MKIRQVTLYNFKGFEHITCDFEGSQAIILGGKNGYGKTTLFDAIELVLTGRIQRYENYSNDCHYGRLHFGEQTLPLVNNCDKDKVGALVTIEYNDCFFELKREAKTQDMKNPIDFEAFSPMMIRLNHDEEWCEITTEQLCKLGLNYFVQSFVFLYYISQEEATSFLKQKENERYTAISNLFNTSDFDRKIDKVSIMLKTLDEIRKETNDSVNVQQKQLDEYTMLSFKDEKNEGTYQRLCSQSRHAWDTEHPNLSPANYQQLLSEDGIIDKVLFAINHFDTYKQMSINNYVNSIIRNENLDDVAFYIQNKALENHILIYVSYLHTEFDTKLQNASITNLPHLATNLPSEILNIIGKEEVKRLDDKIKNIEEIYKNSSEIEKLFANILDERKILIKTIENKEAIHFSTCLLCGHDYKSNDNLLKSIYVTTDELNKKLQGLSANLPILLADLKTDIINSVVQVVEDHFLKLSISKEVAQRYGELDISLIVRNLGKWEEQIQLKQSPANSVENTKIAMQNYLNSLIKSVPDDLSYDQLNQIFVSYVKDIDIDKRTEECIKTKRQYLLNCWNAMKDERLVKMHKEVSWLNKKLDIIDEKNKAYYKLLLHIKNQRREYLQKIVSDMEALFYIYSGRIMQDNYFGRGLFIRFESNRSSVLFVAGNPNSEVDALYSMSSGQLVSVVLSFIMTINKLYGSLPILMIDDPVQTIDDLNLWGLIETLRHEFHDHFLMLSTHEENFGALIRYKFAKINIDAKYIDMQQYHRPKNCEPKS